MANKPAFHTFGQLCKHPSTFEHIVNTPVVQTYSDVLKCLIWPSFLEFIILYMPCVSGDFKFILHGGLFRHPIVLWQSGRINTTHHVFSYLIRLLGSMWISFGLLLNNVWQVYWRKTQYRPHRGIGMVQHQNNKRMNDKQTQNIITTLYVMQWTEYAPNMYIRYIHSFNYLNSNA